MDDDKQHHFLQLGIRTGDLSIVEWGIAVHCEQLVVDADRLQRVLFNRSIMSKLKEHLEFLCDATLPVAADREKQHMYYKHQQQLLFEQSPRFDGKWQSS